MIVIAYGYLLPQLDDTGDVWCDAIAADIQQLANHNHDGVTSALIPAVTQSILSANWAAVSGKPGTYSQVITLPSSLAYDTTGIEIRVSDGTRVLAGITKTSSNSYTVFTNDNTLTYTAVYTA